jgi:CO/xanthine dehydrogenase Mo-binding subunit
VWFAGGEVVVRTGKVELGQGILTALAAIAAAELDVAPRRVRVVAASTQGAPDEGYTAGSLSIQQSGAALRQVCAEVRAVCLAAAAAVLDADPAEIDLRDGGFEVAGRRTTYWDLPTAALLDRDADGSATPVAAAGRPLPRSDLPDKVTGAPRFIADLSPAGLLHARVVRPPAVQAHLRRAATEAVVAWPGVVTTVVDGDFLAVVAEREEIALLAAQALARHSEWEHAALPERSSPPDLLVHAPADTEVVHRRDTGTAAEPVRTVGATYSRPFLAHASIGTSTALACWTRGRLEVWSHTQGVHPLRRALAEALALPVDAVGVHHVEHAGCYGHNGADDAAYDAAVIALRVPDRPVRVVWSRADELGWSPLAPAMRVQLTAGVAADGSVLTWEHELWSGGHVDRPGFPGPPRFLSHRLRRPDEPRVAAADPPLATGGGSTRNAVPGYDFPRQSVTAHRLTAVPVRTSAMRGLGAHLNVFAIESFLDELAAAAGRDPLEYRLAHLTDPRARRVLVAAAERAGWGDAVPEGLGRGLGCARYKNASGYCAVVADVEVVADVRVRRLTVAVDVGTAIDVDGVRNQVEGGAVQATSWTVRERARFDGAAVTSTDWETYPILTFSQVPAVDVVVLPCDEEPLGAGEIAAGPTAAAIANAVAAGLGVRVRDMPVSAEAVVAAIEAG